MELPKTSETKTVVVTGASGFIASHVIKQLCKKDYRVIGTVRGKADDPKYKWIIDLDERPEKKITLHPADLLEEGSFDKAIEQADYVLHVASPYMISVTDPEKDLIEPAVKGTLNVLESCLKHQSNGKLKRVIVTSSVAAITDEPNKKYTEEDWNTRSSANRNAYYYSKVKAEKAAWNFMENHEKECTWDLVVANPYVVIGPELQSPPPKEPNESNGLILRMITGGYPARVNLNWGIVDVRDVAAAHILLIEKPKAKGRHIVAAEVWGFEDIKIELEKVCKDLKIVTHFPCCLCNCRCCYCFLWCFACCEPKGTRDVIRTHINAQVDFDNSKIQSYGDFQFRSGQETLFDTTKWLADAGFLETRS